MQDWRELYSFCNNIMYRIYNIIDLMTVYTNINKLYSSVTFMQKYGLDVWMAIIIVILFLIAITYFTILNHVQPIKADWLEKRCSPNIIPFAGMINTPEGEKPFTYTGENFTYCIRSILGTIVADAFKPIQYLIDMVSEIFAVLAEAVNAIRAEFDTIRGSITNITASIMGRSLNIVIPIMKYMMTIKNIMNKSLGVAAVSVNSVMAAFLSAQSLMLFLFKMFIGVLVIIAAMAMMFWGIPLVGPFLAIAATAIFILLLIPTVRINLFMTDILALQVASPPGPPSCFAGNTLVIMRDNDIKNFSELEIGDILLDGSKVTGTMKLSSKNQKVYVLDGVFVTGNHSIYHADKGWISVEEHPESVEAKHFNKPYVYCINTDKKLIHLGNRVYSDWDDLDEIDLGDMNHTCVNIGVLPRNFTIKDIHYYLDTGFHEESAVILHDTSQKTIKDIKIGDILQNGEKVIGKIKIDAKDLQGVYYYNIHGVKIKCSKNITIHRGKAVDAVDAVDAVAAVAPIDIFDVVHENDKINTSFMSGNEILGIDYLYHIVTDLGTLNISGIVVEDYNSGLEKFLKSV